MLRAGTYTEHLEVPKVNDLTIEAKEGEDAIFDGTEVLEGLEWITDGEVSRASIAHTAAVRQPALIVGGESIQCAPGTGGASVLKNLGECFRWQADEGWPVVFKRDAAEAFYGSKRGGFVAPELIPGTKMVTANIDGGKRCGGNPAKSWADLGEGITAEQCKVACLGDRSCAFAVYKTNSKACTSFASCGSLMQSGFQVWSKQQPAPTPFWYDADAKVLSVNTAAYSKYPGGLPEVRVKVGNAGIYFTKAVNKVTIKGLKFFGATVTTDTSGWEGFYSTQYLRDVRLIGNRFLYHPQNVHIETTTKRGRGKGKYVQLSNNILEFGEGAFFYVGTANLVEENYLAFNGIEKGGDFLFHSLGRRETFKRNTALYNGHSGGLNVWSYGYVALDNLFVAPNLGRDWADTACFHAYTGAQTGLEVRGNWMLGISRTVKSVRFDTSKSTTWCEMGRGGTVDKNVFFGLDSLTIKGDEHLIRSNTGDQMDIITGWAEINNMNANTETTQNAVTSFLSSGTFIDEMPGTFTDNACLGVGAGSSPLCKTSIDADVCGSLRNCNLEALKEGLVNDLSAFDFRPAKGSGLWQTGAGAYETDDPAPMPGAPRPTRPFPVLRQHV
jgi:hypothetical protein